MSGLTSGNSVTLDIHQIVSNTLTDQKNSNAKRRFVKKSGAWDTDVNIGWAMNIYTGYTSGNSGYSGFITNPITGCNSTGDKFGYQTSNTVVTPGASGVTHASGDYLYGTTASTATDIITLNTDKNIFTGTAPGSTMYLYYAVRYDADVKYIETDAEEAAKTIIDDSQFNAADRYFKANASGDSNCFAGLSFQLVDLKLTF